MWISIGMGGAHTATLDEAWVFDAVLPNRLQLSSPGTHSIAVATLQADGQAESPPGDVLSLRVVTEFRNRPGESSVMTSELSGSGGRSDWMEHLKKQTIETN